MIGGRFLVKLFCLWWAILSLAIISNATLAQSGPPPGSGMPANNNPKIETRGRELREGQLRQAEREAFEKKENDKRIESAILQVKEDFSRIQIIRNEIAQRLVAKKPLDYRLIADQTGEIKKRANRLKTFMLPDPGDEKETGKKKLSDLDTANLIGPLVKLCKLIDAFVENPAIKNAGTIDAQQLEKVRMDKAKADQDLLYIIELSGGINAVAQRLMK